MALGYLGENLKQWLVANNEISEFAPSALNI